MIETYFHTRSRLFFCFCDLDIDVYGEVYVIECPPLFGLLRAVRDDNELEPLMRLRSLINGFYEPLAIIQF